MTGLSKGSVEKLTPVIVTRVPPYIEPIVGVMLVIEEPTVS